MASVKAMVGDAFGRLLFREVKVTNIDDLSAHFRKLTLQSDSLQGASFLAGDKVQVLISGEGTRTYTPFDCDPATGVMHFLVYLHGDAPGSAWARTLEVGHRFRAFGPRSSLPLTDQSAPLVLFGDETSFAVAAAVRGLGSAFVFEVASSSESTGIVSALKIPNAVIIERRTGDAHFDELEARLQASLTPHTTLVMTGKAQTIQALRSRLKTTAVVYAGHKVKAYWSVGKRGLD